MDIEQGLSLMRKKMELFTRYEEETWEAIAERTEIAHYKKGDYIVRLGQINKFIGYIQSGIVRIFVIDDEGHEINRSFYFDDDFLSDYYTFLTGQASDECLQVLEDTTLLRLSHTDAMYLFDKYKSFERFGRNVSDYLYLRQRQRIHSLLSKKPEDRYLKLLSEQPKLFQHIPSHHIASYLGITPQSLSRIRSRITSN